MDLDLQTETFQPSEDQRWLGSAHGTNECDSITLNCDAFTALFPDGYVPSGTVLAKNGSYYEPYAASITNEVQTLTEGGSGLTSWTITYAGQTTAALDDDATPAQVQAALEALSNIGAGNVEVTGTSNPIAMTVTFVNDLADRDIAQMTTTPTGGTGTVTVATTTAGGAESPAVVAAGLLFTTKAIRAGAKVSAALYWHGEVIEANLPTNSGIDANAKTDLAHIHFV